MGDFMGLLYTLLTASSMPRLVRPILWGGCMVVENGPKHCPKDTRPNPQTHMRLHNSGDEILPHSSYVGSTAPHASAPSYGRGGMENTSEISSNFSREKSRLRCTTVYLEIPKRHNGQKT